MNIIKKIKNMFIQNSVLFIAGISGSGTTLLASFLRQEFKTAGFDAESALSIREDSILRMRPAKEYRDINDYYRSLIISEKNFDSVKTDIVEHHETLTSTQKGLIIDKAPNAHLVRYPVIKKAFPKAKWIILYRDPVTTIEGLIRKWPDSFGESSILDLCNFYINCHSIVLDEDSFNNFTIVLSYDDLVLKPEKFLSFSENWLNVKYRENKIKLNDLANKQGKGLRNVRNGQIIFDKESTGERQGILNDEEVSKIRNATQSIVAKLEESKIAI